MAIYARVFRQNVDLSVDAQLNFLRDYSRENDYVVVREYVDEDERRHIANTPQFGKMIDEAGLPEAAFNKVLVWKLSRFTRKPEHDVALRACEYFEVPLWLSVMLVMGVRALGVDRVESQLREAGLRESIGYIPGRIPSRSPGLPLLCPLTPSTPNAEGCAPRRQGA